MYFISWYISIIQIKKKSFLSNFFSMQIKTMKIYRSGYVSGEGALHYTTISDPAINEAVSTSVVDNYNGVIVTLTTTGNAQTIQDPTSVGTYKFFTVVNNDTSTDNLVVNGTTLEPGQAQTFLWEGTAWVDNTGFSASDITFIPYGTISSTNVQGAIQELEDDITAIITIPTVEILGTTQAADVNTRYIANNAGLVTITLPAASSVGDILSIRGKGLGGWKLAQNAGQVVYFGDEATTVGVTGWSNSTQQRDCIDLVCITADSEWQVVSSIGSDININ